MLNLPTIGNFYVERRNDVEPRHKFVVIPIEIRLNNKKEYNIQMCCYRKSSINVSINDDNHIEFITYTQILSCSDKVFFDNYELLQDNNIYNLINTELNNL